MPIKDTLTPASELMPWNAVVPRCLLFDTRKNKGNFHNPWFGEFNCYKVVDDKEYVWVLKTPALSHFDAIAHYHWVKGSGGFEEGNFRRLLEQEYAPQIMVMKRNKETTEDEIYRTLTNKLINNNELVGLFPISNSTGIVPDARKHIAVLMCNKTQPVNMVTAARVELYSPRVNRSLITPGVSQMLKDQKSG